MAWLAGAWTVIKALPELISVAKLAIQAYLDIKAELERRKRDEEARKAIAENDKKKMEELLGKK